VSVISRMMFCGCFLLVGADSLAVEHEQGWYAGGGFGSTNYSSRKVKDIDSGDLSLSVFGGYTFNRYFGLQGGYSNLGNYSGGEGLLKSIDLSAINFTAIGILPLGESDFDLFGRLGLAVLNYTQNFELNDEKIENSSTGDAIIAAIGINYTPENFDRMTMAINYDYYYFATETPYVAGDSPNDHSVGVLGLSARYNF
jgi:hypothetical protein